MVFGSGGFCLVHTFEYICYVNQINFRFLQGLPQHINLLFDEPLALPDSNQLQLRIKFQGGFVGNVMSVAIDDAAGQHVYKKCFYPDDINDKQTFTLDLADLATPASNVRKISIVFEKSSDFFGRIIIYHLELTT